MISNFLLIGFLNGQEWVLYSTVYVGTKESVLLSMQNGYQGQQVLLLRDQVKWELCTEFCVYMGPLALLCC